MWFVGKILVPVDTHPSGVIEVIYRKLDRILQLDICLETFVILYVSS